MPESWSRPPPPDPQGTSLNESMRQTSSTFSSFLQHHPSIMEHVNIHPRILDPISRLQEQGNNDKCLHIDEAHHSDCQSVQYLVDFLQGDNSHQVTDLFIEDSSLSEPPDGGLEVLRDFFANDSTLTKKSHAV